MARLNTQYVSINITYHIIVVATIFFWFHICLALNLVCSAAAAGFYYKGRCSVGECCHENHMPADFDRLKQNLSTKIFGQHIAIKTIVSALKHHWQSEHIQKPLTLSLHGLPGPDSKFVHHWVGRIQFPREEEVKHYQKELYSWIKGNVTNCERQLFIFDEVDKIPSTLLDIIKPIIDYNERVEGIDYRKRKRREDIKAKDFEKLITQGAFNEAGGFYLSDTIKSNLIDHYIPFLPMELEHVKKCIIEEFKIRNVIATEHQIEEVLEFVEWGPSPENVFSKTGCKRISQKVAAIIAANEY
ncbi:hypothetical protein Trydic_g21493 [Trypoxylus dichotomus]